MSGEAIRKQTDAKIAEAKARVAKLRTEQASRRGRLNELLAMERSITALESEVERLTMENADLWARVREGEGGTDG